jgi:hypothetical protein
MKFINQKAEDPVAVYLTFHMFLVFRQALV